MERTTTTRAWNLKSISRTEVESKGGGLAPRHFNNRKNPFLFRDAMLKLVHSDNLEYKELTNGKAA